MKAAWADLEPLAAGIIDYHRPWDQRPLRADWSERIRDWRAGLPEGFTLLARDEKGSPVAFLDGHIIRNYGIFEEVAAFIDNAFVVESARRGGAGTALLRRFEAWARQRGASEVQLHVSAGNALGKSFWGREGFTPYVYAMHKLLEETST